MNQSRHFKQKHANFYQKTAEKYMKMNKTNPMQTKNHHFEIKNVLLIELHCVILKRRKMPQI